jgi:nitrogen fixation/metabolism regulation signal transduction histidine kinase
MAFKDTVLNIVKNAAESIEEQSIEAALQEIHDEDPAEWAVACDGGEVFAKKIQAKTKSAFVKAVLQGVIDAVNDSRKDNAPAGDTTGTSAN